jgi:hypothetical protein
MIKFIDIISPIYQDLLEKCKRRKISINLDIEDLTLPIADDERVRKFYKREITRALKLCANGDKITISEAKRADVVRFSVKNSSTTQLDAETVEKLRAEEGIEVRSRYGFDTIVTLKISNA